MEDMEFIIQNYKVDYEINKVDIYSKLSKGMKKVIDWQTKESDGAFDTNCSWDELRRKYIKERKFWNEGGPKAYKITESKVEGPVGDIPIRLYYPDNKEKHYVCVFMHGGGFTVGNNDTHDRMMRCLMESGDCAVVGIDYTLSPEQKFPIQLYECAAVVKYLHKHGDEFGLYTDHMALAGDSGGGNLAIATNLYLRDVFSNEYISALLLFYPTTGLYDGISNRLYGTELDGMRRCDLEYYDRCYIPKDADLENPYYRVINNNLTYGVPATYICCGDLDPLLDGCKLLNIILSSHGVKTEMEIVPGVLHAFMHYGKMMDEAIDCLNNSGAFYKASRE
ncbi:acetyl esterase [Clostridium botulinum]|uniref:acetyl esterase n=1 Tax=Clostridium botulinum TaxID=1491 RepID=UPI000A8CB364|nr:acetyl esterase [Clostridium botulinum]